LRRRARTRRILSVCACCVHGHRLTRLRPGRRAQIGLTVTATSEQVGAFALAYAVHKAASPIRFPPTVALTPVRCAAVLVLARLHARVFPSADVSRVLRPQLVAKWMGKIDADADAK
jgi:hypothetical protein